jgi:hypothetical protein
MANAQQMMQQMSQMDDNSSVGRANVAIDDEKQKRNRGVIKVSTMLPQKEVSVDETGALNIKMGFRQATPQEQQAQFATQKAQMDLQREEGKRSLLSGYIKGDLQEGAIIQGMKDFNITEDEFDMAAKARDRMKQIVSTQTFSGQPVDLPADQPFRFKPTQKRTDTQNTASIFANRAEEAEGVFSKLDNYISQQGFDKFTAKIAPNFLKGADQQMYEQAQRNFVNAVLRKESGAVIADSEFKNAEIQYFPQPGDTPEVIKQKADNRRTQIEGLKVTAGQAMSVDGGQPKTQTQSSVPGVGGMFKGEKVKSIKRIR